MKLQLDPAFSTFYLYFMNSLFDASRFLDIPILHELKFRFTMVLKPTRRSNLQEANITLNQKVCKLTSVIVMIVVSHSKIDKTKILMTNGSLTKVKSIAEFCNTFDLH